MSATTDIQWCDSTVNPIMGCEGCELLPSANSLLKAIDGSVSAVIANWPKGEARDRYQALISSAYNQIEKPDPGHKNEATRTNVWHLRGQFIDGVEKEHGQAAARAGQTTIERQVTCYAARLHFNKGLSLLNPGRKANTGFAPTFEALTPYPDRVTKAAKWSDLLGRADSDRPWMERLPRLIFVSDMGDAFCREDDFDFLQRDVIDPITSPQGRQHLWLWLTKRPKVMAKFARKIGGFPDNVCAMTTVSSQEWVGRIDDLREVQASMRGLSVEPLRGRIPTEHLDLTNIDWLIAGGESGGDFAHPFEIEWAEELRDHCKEKGVAFFLKQLGCLPRWKGQPIELKHPHGGDWNEWPDEALKVREFPRCFSEYRKDEMVEQKTLRRESKGGLCPSEIKAFNDLDRKVSNFARNMIHAADALFEIRERRLYRAKHKTFQEYCESVHHMSRQYASRLIQAGKIRAELLPVISAHGLPGPENEAQLRELARLKDPQSRVEAYREACEENRGDQKECVAPTARTIAKVVAKRANDVPRVAPKGVSPSRRLEEARRILGELEEACVAGGELGSFLSRLRQVLEDGNS